MQLFLSMDFINIFIAHSLEYQLFENKFVTTINEMGSTKLSV